MRKIVAVHRQFGATHTNLGCQHGLRCDMLGLTAALRQLGRAGTSQALSRQDEL